MVVSTGTLQKHLSSESMLVTLPVLSGFSLPADYQPAFLDRRCWFGFPIVGAR